MAQQAQQQLGAAAIVVSPDPAVLALAATYNLTPLPEDPAPLSGYGLRVTGYGEPTLNAALEQATAHALQHNASAVLILPADLPLLTLADVQRLWRASQQLYADSGHGDRARQPGAGHQRAAGAAARRAALSVRPRQLPSPLPAGARPGTGLAHRPLCRGWGWTWICPPTWSICWPSSEADSALAAEQPASEETIMHDDQHTTPLDDSTLAFLHEPGLLMRLGTVGSDGYPQVTPIWYLYDEGRFWITTASDRVKGRNMLARPEVGFAIDSDQRPYRGVSARGEALLVAEGEAARPITRRIAARYVPAERLEAMVDTLMEAPRVVFAIDAPRVVKMGSW